MKNDIITLIVFFMLGFNLCIPAIKQFTEDISAATVKAESLGDDPGDNASAAYDYWYAPENSFGISETKSVNWSYFKQLFNEHFYKNARYKRYSHSEWTDGTQYLTLNKTWNDTGFWKVDIILDVPIDLYSVNISFGCDLPVLNYIERDGYEIWLNYTANETETYSVMFNWSDIAQIPNIEIYKVRQDGKFWISFKRDNVPAGHYEFDPIFGNNGVRNYDYDMENHTTAIWAQITGADGYANNISVYFVMSEVDTYTGNVTCGLYEYLDYDTYFNNLLGIKDWGINLK